MGIGALNAKSGDLLGLPDATAELLLSLDAFTAGSPGASSKAFREATPDEIRNCATTDAPPPHIERPEVTVKLKCSVCSIHAEETISIMDYAGAKLVEAGLAEYNPPLKSPPKPAPLRPGERLGYLADNALGKVRAEMRRRRLAEEIE